VAVRFCAARATTDASTVRVAARLREGADPVYGKIARITALRATPRTVIEITLLSFCSRIALLRNDVIGAPLTRPASLTIATHRQKS
jgi:hypothetical protein